MYGPTALSLCKLLLRCCFAVSVTPAEVNGDSQAHEQPPLHSYSAWMWQPKATSPDGNRVREPPSQYKCRSLDLRHTSETFYSISCVYTKHVYDRSNPLQRLSQEKVYYKLEESAQLCITWSLIYLNVCHNIMQVLMVSS